MPTYRRGKFFIQLDFEPLDGELAESDRQLAWKAYLQIANCPSVRGYLSDEQEGGTVSNAIEQEKTSASSGELSDEQEGGTGSNAIEQEKTSASFGEIKTLSRQLVEIAQQFPMGQPAPNREDLGALLAKVLEVALNPFIYTWEFHYQHNNGQPASNPGKSIGGLSEENKEDLKRDWRSLCDFFRELLVELPQKYGFVCLESTLPKHVRLDWREYAATVVREAKKFGAP